MTFKYQIERQEIVKLSIERKDAESDSYFPPQEIEVPSAAWDSGFMLARVLNSVGDKRDYNDPIAESGSGRSSMLVTFLRVLRRSHNLSLSQAKTVLDIACEEHKRKALEKTISMGAEDNE